MDIQTLIADLKTKGAFGHYEILDVTKDNFYAGIQANGEKFDVKLHVVGVRTTEPAVAMIVMFSEGLDNIAGKNMLSVLPMLHSVEDDRDESAALSLGKNALIHMIDGMVKREQANPGEVEREITMFMIHTMIKFDENQEPMGDEDGSFVLSSGGELMAENIGKAAFWGWTDRDMKEEMILDA
ncbi:hypothetical protein MF451_003732 [Salmonella enterica subsp. enterica serovar Saintpaul]|nr:hypothetical protein [Salmonella enterica subsp. enterica serovar Saintpaul]